MHTDPFSDILNLANARSVVSGTLSAGRGWSIRFRPPDKIKFFAIVEGGCWLRVEEAGAEPVRVDPIRIEQGDVLLVSRRPIVLADDPVLPPIDATDFYAGLRADPTRRAHLGEGDGFMLLGGHVEIDPANGAFLADILPALILVRASAPEATTLRWLLDELARERRQGKPGSDLASTQLAQLVFIQILRTQLERSNAAAHEAASPLAAGWLRALGDAHLAPALRLMHGEPGRSWQLAELAKAAAMSRTSFAVHFKAVAGVAPLTYLTEWRMRLAQRALRDETTPVSTLALNLGYTSESAFSNAFKRVTGTAPKRYRALARAPETPAT
ncbi:MAG: AraC family transcriptional regulator [Azospirillaceae bacterium]|nr:AraC family transcriptional regulator [Azospirillaceae bacterium]